MESQSNNPWAARFEPLLDRDTIKERATVVVPSLQGLHDMTTEHACKQLENALKTVFYPTSQCVEILHRFVDISYAHCQITYPNNKAFIQGVYSEHPPLPKFAFPILLTGLAGVGKSELMTALTRIQMDEQSIIVDADHGPFTLKGAWQLIVDVRNTSKAILNSLVPSEGAVKDLIKLSRKVAFRDGIPSLHADEFQYATTSSNSNALVTQMLLSLGLIGIPWTYNANFSLVHRILKRPEEDRQRLIADFIVLQPDSPYSEDWINTLKAQKSVAEDILTFNPERDAKELHVFTAGRKRAMAKLLVLTLRNEHPRKGNVNLAAIKETYLSPGFASYREESEIILTQTIEKRPNKKRPDLWCPLPIPSDASDAFLKHATEQRNERVADAELESSLNKKEREALQSIKRSAKKAVKPTGEVIPIRRNAPPTADELKQNSNWFKDQL